MDRLSPPLFTRIANRFQTILLLLGLIFAPTLMAHVGSDYITINQYTAQNPEQSDLMQLFSAQVESQAMPALLQQTAPIKIAAVYPGQQQSDYWRRNIKALKHRLDKLKLDYQFDDYPLRTSTPLAQQQQSIDSALAKDPDYLILTLDDTNQKRLIERLLVQSRPKIILLNITTPLKSWAARQPLIYIGFDHIKGSQMLADHLFLSRSTPPTNVGVLYHQPGYVSRMRGGAFTDSMKQHGAQLHSAYYSLPDRELAYNAAQTMLQSAPPPDFIYACSTDLALDAIQAIKQAGLKKTVGINGWGGGSAELEAIHRGDLELTVMRMNDDSGIAIAEAISNDQQKLPVPQIYSGRMVIVTQQHSAKQIRQLSDTAFRYSGR